MATKKAAQAHTPYPEQLCLRGEDISVADAEEWFTCTPDASNYWKEGEADEDEAMEIAIYTVSKIRRVRVKRTVEEEDVD